jgi:hypothetical protein
MQAIHQAMAASSSTSGTPSVQPSAAPSINAETIASLQSSTAMGVLPFIQTWAIAQSRLGKDKVEADGFGKGGAAWGRPKNNTNNSGGGSGSTSVPKPAQNHGVQTSSTTLLNKNGIRIDVENPNPGARPGQIHVHYGAGKYIYDLNSNSFRTVSGQPAPNKVQDLLLDNNVLRAIEKGLQYLGH